MKNFIKNCFNLLGLDIRLLKPHSDDISQIVAVLKKVQTNLIFDIGANKGKFSQDIRKRGYGGEIVSFEPLTAARKKLLIASSDDPNWIIHKRVAVGEKNGIVDINISKNLDSSSIFPMLNQHLEAEKNSIYVGKEKTQIVTLDSVANDYIKENTNYFIKIDTQGYEAEVINGAKKSLINSKGIICELSLVPLYEGQLLWREIIKILEKEGFILWSIIKGFTDRNDGRTLQLDGIFLKKNKEIF